MSEFEKTIKEAGEPKDTKETLINVSLAKIFKK